MIHIFFDAGTGFRYLHEVREPIARSRRRSWPAVAALVLSLVPLSNINASGDAGLTVVGMDVRVELRPEQGLMTETARITLEGSSGPVVRFRLNQALLVERSRAGKGVAGHSQTGDELTVTMTPPMENERRTLTLVMTGRPRYLGADRITENGAVLGGADHWIPTLPLTAAMVNLEVVAPPGWAVLGSGEPAAGRTGEIHRFQTMRPVRSVGLAAGPGLRTTVATLARTPLRVIGDQSRDAAGLASIFADPMTWLSGTVAPYPFESLNLAFVPGIMRPAYAGGFIAIPADQATTTLADGADLIASLWFGQHLAGDGPWMESLAAWQAMAYARDRGQGVPSRLAAQRDRYLSMSGNRDVAISRADGDTAGAVIRGKGSSAWDMIRMTCGNRHFQARMAAMTAEPFGPPLELAAVRARFADGTAEPVEMVFIDWFDRIGLPRFTTALKTLPTSRDEWRADLSIKQLGRAYTLSLDVVFHGAGQEHRETIRIDQHTTQLLFVLPFQALRVELDPLGRIFKQPTFTRKQ